MYACLLCDNPTYMCTQLWFVHCYCILLLTHIQFSHSHMSQYRMTSDNPVTMYPYIRLLYSEIRSVVVWEIYVGIVVSRTNVGTILLHVYDCTYTGPKNDNFTVLPFYIKCYQKMPAITDVLSLFQVLGSLSTSCRTQQ